MNKSKKWASALAIALASSSAVSIIAATTTVNPITNIINGTKNTIGAQKAKEIALNHANLKANDVFFTKAKLDYDDHVAVYEVEFFYNNTEYDYEIIASNGQIKEFKTEAHNSNIIDNIISNTPNNSQQTIGAQKAKEIALSHANLKADDVFFTKAKLDYDDSTAIYEVEFFYNNTEYDYEIIASNGQVKEFKTEAQKSNTTNKVTPPSTSLPNENNTSNNTSTNAITLDKAKQIALNHANLSAGNVSFKKAKLDYDDGIKIYEIEFYYNGIEYNYEINAADGNILEFDIDRD